jgi:hypothetical protein
MFKIFLFLLKPGQNGIGEASKFFYHLTTLKNGTNGPIFMGDKKKSSPAGWTPYLCPADKHSCGGTILRGGQNVSQVV